MTPLQRPASLETYISTNDVMPAYAQPTLDAYLAQLASVIGGMDDELVKLQTIVDRKRVEKECVALEYSLCRRITSLTRRIPPEILGVIFVFAVGLEPSHRYIEIVRLRGVCSSWRRVALTTPGLWDELHIELHRWCLPDGVGHEQSTLQHYFADRLKPGLAILTRKRPYCLSLDYRGYKLDPNEEILQSQMVHHPPIMQPSARNHRHWFTSEPICRIVVPFTMPIRALPKAATGS